MYVRYTPRGLSGRRRRGLGADVIDLSSSLAQYGQGPAAPIVINPNVASTDLATQIDAAAAANAAQLAAAGIRMPATPSDRTISYPSSVAGADACIRQIPSWCNWPGMAIIANFSSECAPYSDAELHQLSVCQLAKVAAVNPTLAAQGVAAADAAQAAAEAADPQGTCELNAAVNHPTLAGILGPSMVCSLGGGGPQGQASYGPYLAIAAVVAAGLFFLGLVKR